MQGQVLVPSCIHRHVCLRVSIPVTPKRVLNLQVSRDGTLYVDANHREAACVIRILCTKAPLAYKCLQKVGADARGGCNELPFFYHLRVCLRIHHSLNPHVGRGEIRPPVSDKQANQFLSATSV